MADNSREWQQDTLKVGRDDLSPVTLKYIQAAAERSQAPAAERRSGGSHHGRSRS